ncbi:hypothetical protein ABZ769_24990 [Streptomyces olivoreticuli]
MSASCLILGQASAAQADGHHGDGNPVLVVSPAPGKLTKVHSESWAYQYDPKAGSSDDSSGSSGSSTPPQAPAPAPGPVQNATDTAKSTVASAAGGASSTVGSL